MSSLMKTLRVSFPLAFGMALVPVLGAAQATEVTEVTEVPQATQVESARPPGLSRSMLVFDDQSHFDAVMNELTARQELENQIGASSSDDREAPVFQEYSESLGFESLLHAIEAAMAAAEEGQASTFLTTDDPDAHHVADPYLRGLLNPQSEIQVGDTVYRFHPNGHYKFNAADTKTLEDLRAGLLPDEGPGITFVAKVVSGGCCKDSHNKQATYTYAEGDRRMRAHQWVERSNLRTSWGVSTTNLKRVWGIWVRAKADRLGASAALMRLSADCSAGVTDGDTVEAFGVNKVSIVDASPISKVGNYFDSAHWAQDEGDGREETLSMCQCLPVVASFSMPNTVTDSSNVPFNGTGTWNESSYAIEIYRTTSVGSHTKLGLSAVEYYVGQAGSINLAELFNFDYLDGDAVYRVRLIAHNSCGQSDEDIQWITANDTTMHVQYKSYVKGLGWLKWVFNGATSGTTGQSRRMEATRLRLVNAPQETKICYRVHLAGQGWKSWRCDGQIAGTTTQDRRMEAIQIDLQNAPLGCTIQYQAHVKGDGWQQGWVNEGQIAGTTGQSRRMEALRVRLVNCP